MRTAGKQSARRGAGARSPRRLAARPRREPGAAPDGHGPGDALPLRWNPDPEDVQRSVVKLALTIVELLRRLMEEQAVRRIEAGTLTAHETESVGRALMDLEETIAAIGRQFDLSREDLNLDLGPLGRLL